MLYRMPNRVFLVLLIGISSVAHAQPAYHALVVSVTDGDTVIVLTDDKEQVKIRLAEIDTPERKQPWYNKAKQALSVMVIQKAVLVNPVTKDRYGRTVAHLSIGQLQVNREMVSTGNAWVYRKYMKDATLLDLESDAKAKKVGLWGLPESERIPPWEWRKKKHK